MKKKIGLCLLLVWTAWSAAANEPATVLWSQFQTPIRQQKKRDTCAIFAIVAAMEARYLRQYGISLDLSEQYAWHLYKSTALNYPPSFEYENQSSFWGSGSSHGVQKLQRYSIPLETFSPYLDQPQMEELRNEIPEAGALFRAAGPEMSDVTQDQIDAFEYSPKYIPTSAIENSHYGIESYQFLNAQITQSSDAMEKLIASGNEIVVGVSLQWLRDPSTGIFHYRFKPKPKGHVFLVVGYDHEQRFFYVKNSWGEKDFLKVDYEFFQKASHGGSLVTSVTDPEHPHFEGRTLGLWNIDFNGWQGKLTLRRTNEDTQVTRLGEFVDSEGVHHSVNGRSLENGRGMRFSIENSNQAPPRDLWGQLFEVDFFAQDINYATGTTRNRGTTSGVLLSRDPISVLPGSKFLVEKWLGDWKVNINGQLGKLQLTKVVDGATGSFTDAAGVSHPVTGALDSDQNHILQLEIGFDPAHPVRFTLFFHTGDEGLFSGQSVGNRYGIFGIK